MDFNEFQQSNLSTGILNHTQRSEGLTYNWRQSCCTDLSLLRCYCVGRNRIDADPSNRQRLLHFPSVRTAQYPALVITKIYMFCPLNYIYSFCTIRFFFPLKIYVTWQICSAKLAIPILPQNTIHSLTTCEETCLTKLESKSMWACTYSIRRISLSMYSYRCLCILRRGYPDWGFSVLFPQL